MWAYKCKKLESEEELKYEALDFVVVTTIKIW